MNSDQPKMQHAESFVPLSIRRAISNDASGREALNALDGDAALCWCDIRKFTPLSSRLVASGPKGIESLHAILVSHYNNALNVITRHGGEPLLYAGDALLTCFPCDTGNRPLALRRAVACASALLSMEDTIDDQGEPLTCNVHVSVGTLALSAVGPASLRISIAHGSALLDLASIANVRVPGSVVVTKAVHNLLPDVKVKPATSGFQLIHPPVVEAVAPPARLVVNDALLAPYLAAPVKAGLETGDLAWVSELRRVSIVFVQLPEFDSAAAGTAERLHSLVQLIAPAAQAHEATLNQMVIDDKGLSILLYQGVAPLAHPDDPERAVTLALNLRAAFIKEGVLARFGVTTGNAYCGIIGGNALSHYIVIGSHVNLAARLMEATDRGILVDTPTVQAANAKIIFEEKEPLTLKGFEREVPVWTPISHRETTSRAVKGFVGREEELNRMRACLGEVLAGTQQTIKLNGPAGIGKTHLLSEFIGLASNQGLKVVRGRGLAVLRDLSYHAVQSMFESLLSAEGGSKAERQAHVLATLGERASEAGLLSAVLPLDFEDSPELARLSGEQRAAKTRALLCDLVAEAAGDGLVVAIEDAHWADTSSLELLNELSRIERPILVVLEVRTMSQQEQVVDDRVVEINLDSFNRVDQDKLTCLRTGSDKVQTKLSEFLAIRSHGQPLFLLEIVGSLADAKQVAVVNNELCFSEGLDLSQITLPDTVQGVIIQRLDRLPAGPQLTLKIASSVGVAFPTQLVLDVHPRAREINCVCDDLRQLCDLGLIHTTLVEQREGYTFHHDVTREVAYGLLPFQQRRTLHEAIACWWEATPTGPEPGQFVMLAHHWEHAERPERAVDYLEKEAVRAFSAGLASASVAVGMRAASLLGVNLPTSIDQITEQIEENMSAAMKALANRSPSDLFHLPLLSDSKIIRLQWLLPRIGPFCFQTRQMELFTLLAVTGLRLAIEHGQGPPTADVYSMYSPVHHFLTGDRLGAEAFSQLALKVDHANGRTMRARVAFVHTWFHHHWTAPLDLALPMVLEAAEAGFQSGDVLFGCFNLSAYVIYLNVLGRPLDDVERVATDHLERNNQRVVNAEFHLIHERQVARAFAGRTHSLQSLSNNDIDEQRDIASICQTEFSNQIGYYLVSRLKLAVHAGDYEGGASQVRDVLAVLSAFERQVAEFEFIQYGAIAILRAKGKSAIHEARTLIEKMQSFAGLCPDNFQHKAALITAEISTACGCFDPHAYRSASHAAAERGFTHDEGLTLELLGRSHAARDESDAARAAFNAARDAYDRWGAHAKVWLINRLLAGVK